MKECIINGKTICPYKEISGKTCSMCKIPDGKVCDICERNLPLNCFHENETTCDDCVYELFDSMGTK